MTKKKQLNSIGGIPVLDYQNLQEESKWKEIQVKLVELNNPKDQLVYLHNCMADYIENMPSKTVQASAIVLKDNPYLGKLFLDKKISAEIERITGIYNAEKLFDNPINKNNSESLEDLEYQERICLLYSLGIFNFLKKTFQIESSSTLGGIMETPMKIKKGTITKTLDRIEKEGLMKKFDVEISRFKKKHKLV